jgi:hypothetical protein
MKGCIIEMKTTNKETEVSLGKIFLFPLVFIGVMIV